MSHHLRTGYAAMVGGYESPPRNPDGTIVAQTFAVEQHFFINWNICPTSPHKVERKLDRRGIRIYGLL
jgi:hypothetical protein